MKTVDPFALEAWRDKALRRITLAAAMFAAVPLVMSVTNAYLAGQPLAALIFSVLYFLLWTLIPLRRFYYLRAWGSVGLLYLVGVMAMVFGGVAGAGRLYLFMLPVFTLFILGTRAGFFVALVNLGTIGLMAFLAQTGWLRQWLTIPGNALLLPQWIEEGAIFAVLLAILLGLAGWYVQENKRLHHEAEQRQQALARDLALVSEISAHSLDVHNLNDVLAQFARQIQTQLRLAGVQVFLAEGQELVLQADTSGAPAGSIRRPMTTSDTPDRRTLRRKQSLSEETQAEIVIPLAVGDQLLGALHLRRASSGPLWPDQRTTFVILADQLAITIQSARLHAGRVNLIRQLENASRLKTQFLANMSHELRNALNAILGYSNPRAVSDEYGAAADVMLPDLRRIHRHAEHLLHIINELLDLTRIESGMEKLNAAGGDLRQDILEALEMVQPRARAKGLSLALELPPEENFELRADHMRVRQILLNLIDNAVKYTPQGGVTVRGEATGEMIRISVQDTGDGIPLDYQALIFDPFQRLDYPLSRKSSGTGLGLPLARHLAEMHGGRLWVESPGAPGGGALFVVELPKRAVETP